jgi:hypothetical protein
MRMSYDDSNDEADRREATMTIAADDDDSSRGF